MAGDGSVRINMEEATLAECGVHFSQKPALLSGAFPRAGTQRPRRAVSSLIPLADYNGELLVSSSSVRELQCLTAQEAEMLQTGSGCRQLVCKVYKGYKGPSLAITESRVSDKTNEGSG